MSDKEAAESSLTNRGYERLVFYSRTASERSYDEEYEGRGPGFLRYTNITDLLASFFLGSRSQGERAFNWRDMCIGISSEVVAPSKMLHVPFLDYDGKHIKTAVKQDVKLLQERFGLGPAHVYHTKRGAHVYFLHDIVPEDKFRGILESTSCCPGFKKTSLTRGFSIIRVSAKYTEFDIALEQVIPAIDTRLRRMTRKGHVIEALLGLGMECGTHLAGLFPNWANYIEDGRPWKLQPRRTPHERGKFIIKQAAPKPAAAAEGPAAGQANALESAFGSLITTAPKKDGNGGVYTVTYATGGNWTVTAATSVANVGEWYVGDKVTIE